MTDALVVRNLVKVYKSGVKALNQVSLTIEAGDFFALLGPNGAGKSTLIGIIASLVKKNSGKITIFGYDLDEQLSLAKSCMGLVPQEFNFNSFERVLDIVVNQAGYYGMPKRLAQKKAEFYLKRLDLWSKRDQAAGQLSGGMKRRLMIARALVYEPKLLILDEPTAGVDIELRRATWEFLKEINDQGVTIILTTHYLEEAENLCRHMAIIHKGEMIQSGNLRDLLGQLHKETIVFQTMNRLEKQLVLPQFTTRRLDDWTFEVDLCQQDNLSELFELLQTKEIKIRSMRNKANRLEELFLHLVTSHLS